MKKFIIGFILFAITAFVSTPVLAETAVVKDSTELAIQDLQSVNTTVIFISQKIEAMAQALKVPAEHVYKVLVKQQVVNAWTDIMLLLLLATSSFLFIYTPIKYISNKNKAYRKANKDSYSVKNNPDYVQYELDSPETQIPIAIGVVLAIFFIIGLLCTTSDIIMGLTNPEYGAIKDIIEVLK